MTPDRTVHPCMRLPWVGEPKRYIREGGEMVGEGEGRRGRGDEERSGGESREGPSVSCCMLGVCMGPCMGASVLCV